MATKKTQDELREEAMRRFTVSLDGFDRVTLHNAVVRLFNRKKPKNARDSEWAMERAKLRQLLMKLKKPEDPARQAYEKDVKGFEL